MRCKHQFVVWARLHELRAWFYFLFLVYSLQKCKPDLVLLQRVEESTELSNSGSVVSESSGERHSFKPA